jgi:hypothetical protein
MEARPTEEGLAEAIDVGHIGPRDDPKNRAKILSEEFGWDKHLAKKIWCVGPETTGPNVVVDMCKGVLLLLGSNGLQRKVPRLKKTREVSALKSVMWFSLLMPFTQPLEAGTQAAQLVTDITNRKGLKEQMTPLSEFENKL